LLLSSGKGRPTQVTLRRAVSTAYYALFHALAGNCADMLIGTSKSSRSKHAWAEVYRSPSHGAARSACEDRAVISRFPDEIVSFAAAFADMQGKRNAADYDPTARYLKSAVLADIDRAERVISTLWGSPTKDRRAFASWVLFRNVTNKSRQSR
jgi:hypothetical protein